MLALSSNGGSAAVSLSGTGAQSVADIDPAPFAFYQSKCRAGRLDTHLEYGCFERHRCAAPIAVAGAYSIDGGAFAAHRRHGHHNGQAVQVSPHQRQHRRRHG